MKFRLLTLSAFTSLSAFAGPITFDMMPTVQNCNHPGHQRTWCELEDLAPSTASSGLEARIISQLDRALAHPDTASVFAAEFSFSNKPIQQKMCALGKAGVPVKIYLDVGSSADLAFAKNPDCQKDPANPNLVAMGLGGFTNFPEWRLHHNKTVMIDAGDGSDLNINFSSGNLSKFGMSLHMDHWVMTLAPKSTNLARATSCLFESLEAAYAKAVEVGMYANGADFSKDPIVMSTYKAARQSCYVSNQVIAMDDPEQAVALEGIAPFFTPNDGQQALQTLKREFKKVGAQVTSGPAYIYIAIEHFSSQTVANTLLQAAEAGVDVRIVLNAGTVSGASEVAGDKPFYDKNFRDSKVKVRFIDTNPSVNGGPGQQMHNKFAILNGKRVFSGAGHYTSSGLDSNFETLYLTQDEVLTKKYGLYFKDLWDISVDEEFVVNHTAATAPDALSDSFMQMIAN